MAKVDVDGSGGLEPLEFRKMIRAYQKWELQESRLKFYEVDNDGSGSVDSTELGQVLKGLGYPNVTYDMTMDCIRMAAKYDDAHEISFKEFVAMMGTFREKEVVAVRKRAGYTEEEVMGFREMFNIYEQDQGGTLDGLELLKFLADVGRQPKTQKDQEIFQRILREAVYG